MGLVDILVTEEIVDTELPVLVCSKLVGLSPFVGGLMRRASAEDAEAGFATLVTAPIPLTDDLTTGSSFVLSRTNNCMGIG